MIFWTFSDGRRFLEETETGLLHEINGDVWYCTLGHFTWCEVK